MRFLTAEECEVWLANRGRQKEDLEKGKFSLDIKYPGQPYTFLHFGEWISWYLVHREPVLLWVTCWDVWGSENWHLYYTLRRNHADRRLLEDAPGHLFVGYERADIASFIQLTMLHGWDAYYLQHADYVSARFSNDEFVTFYSRAREQLEPIREGLAPNEQIRESQA